jgi:hypothetical protein
MRRDPMRPSLTNRTGYTIIEEPIMVLEMDVITLKDESVPIFLLDALIS